MRRVKPSGLLRQRAYCNIGCVVQLDRSDESANKVYSLSRPLERSEVEFVGRSELDRVHKFGCMALEVGVGQMLGQSVSDHVMSLVPTKLMLMVPRSCCSRA